MKPAAPVTRIFTDRPSTVGRGKHVLDVVDHVVLLAKAPHTAAHQARGTPGARRRRSRHRNARLAACAPVVRPYSWRLGRVRPRVVDVDAWRRDSCSSRITSTTLELRMSGQFSLNVRPSTSTRAPLTWMRLLAMSRVICPVDVQRHVVVEAPPGEDHLGVIADLLRLVRQVVGVDADAVTADEAGAERQEVPLAAGGLQHFLGVDAEAVEDQRQLVDERDVDVALRVLDDLGGLGDADATRPGACRPSRWSRTGGRRSRRPRASNRT